MKRLFLMVFLLLPFLISTGCWNKTEVEDLAIATAIGLDRVPDDEQSETLFSILVLKSANAGGGGSGSGSGGGQSAEQTAGWVNFGQGNSLDDAKRNLATTTAKKILLGHSRMIVLGEEKAKEGVGDIADFLTRNEGIRLRNLLFVVSGGTAIDAFSTSPEMSSTFSEEVNDLITLSAPRASKSHAVDLKNFLTDLARAGKEVALPLLEIRNLPAEDSSSQESGKSKIKKNIRLKGMAVFKEERMIGKLEDIETRGFLWIIGEAQRGTLTFPVENSGTKKPVQVTVEMTRSKSKIETKIVQGKPVFKVNIDAEGNLSEFSNNYATITPHDIELIDQGYTETIKKEIMLALNKCQKDFASDVFGFGRVLHRQQFRYWKENNLEKNWRSLFPQVEVQVAVKANVRRTGLSTSGIKAE